MLVKFCTLSLLPALVLATPTQIASPSITASHRGILISFLVISLLIWAIYKIFIYPNFRSPIRHLPTPENAHFIFGHMNFQFGLGRENFYERITNDIPNDGLIRLKGIFNSDALLLTSPKAFQEMLVSKSYDFPKPEGSRKFLEDLIGNGLVVSEGNFHKVQRKHSLPSFGFRQIKNLYPLFWAKALTMTKAINNDAFLLSRLREPSLPAGVIDIEYWAPKVTLDIIGVAGLGRDFDSLGGSADEIAHLYEELTRNSPDEDRYAMIYVVLGKRLAKLLMPRTAKATKNVTHQLRKLCEEFVSEKRAQLKNQADKPADTLALLLASGAFSNEELVDQLLTIIAAGHETTSSAFTWTIYALATRPDLQSRLREEIRTLPAEVLSGGSADQLATCLESLPLLNGVCNETLRVYPTVPVIGRSSKIDNTILGCKIRAGTQMFISPWAVNKDRAIWGKNAGEYNPDRWIDQETGKSNNSGGAVTNFAMMTFIHGPRSCMGQGFAKAELKCLVAAMVGMYTFELEDSSKLIIPAGVVTTKPNDGLRVRLTKVEDWEG